MDIQQAKQQVADAGRTLLTDGLVARTWGNVSCRTGENAYVITPSGMGYENMTADDVTAYDMTDGSFSGAHKPSSEKGVHTAAYRRFPDAGFIIHTHQTYATALGLAGFAAAALSEQEEAALGGLALAAYGLPGSKKLIAAVEKAMAGGAHAILMAHHGALVIGRDAEEAFLRVRLLETVSRRACKGQPAAQAGDTAALEDICARVRTEYGCAACTGDPAVVAASETEGVRTQLDDTAQMIGKRLITVPADAEKVVSALKNQDAVLVQGLGAVSRAGTDGDAQALCLLAEKTCVCYLHTRACGVSALLSSLDVSLMRRVYLTKYSKKISGQEPAPDKTREELWRTLKFVLFSISAGVIQIVSFTLLNELLHWPGVAENAEYGPNYFIALLLSVIWNFTFNRKFTFQSANNVPIAMLKVLGYYAVFTPLSIWWGVALTRIGWNEYVVLIGTMLINFVTEFLFDRFIVFRTSIDTNDVAKKKQAKDQPASPEK